MYLGRKQSYTGISNQDQIIDKRTSNLFKIVSAETEDCIWQNLKNMYCFSCSYVPLQH